MRGPTQSILLLVTAALAAGGGFWGARLTGDPPDASATTEPAEQAPAIPVVTEAIRKGDLSDMASAFGVIQSRPADAIVVSVPFESKVKSVHTTSGESVAAGAVLIEIEASPDALLQMRQAEEAFAVADRTLEQVRHRRDEQLATNADVATAEQAQQLARTQLDAQQRRGIGRAQTLKAERAGVVTSVGVQVGQTLPSGTALVTLAPDSSLELRLGVDPHDLPGLAVGAAVTVAVPDSANTLAGSVRQQSHTLNAQRLCDVFVAFNGVIPLPAGTFVRAEFSRQTVSGLIVPRDATQLEDDQWCVYVVKDAKALRHVVNPGPSDGHDIVITGDDLAEGDAVVVERNGELQDGAAVTAEPPEEDAK